MTYQPLPSDDDLTDDELLDLIAQVNARLPQEEPEEPPLERANLRDLFGYPSEPVVKDTVSESEDFDDAEPESDGMIFAGLSEVVEDAYLAPQLQDFNEELHLLPVQENTSDEQRWADETPLSEEAVPENDGLIFAGLSEVVEDAYLAPQLQDFNEELHLLPMQENANDGQMWADETPLSEEDAPENEGLIFAGLSEVVEDAYLAPQLQDFNEELHLLPVQENTDEDQADETPLSEEATTESDGMIFAGLSEVVEDAYLAPQLQDFNEELHLLPVHEATTDEDQADETPLSEEAAPENDGLIFAGLSEVVEDAYLAPQLQGFNKELGLLPAQADEVTDPREVFIAEHAELIAADGNIFATEPEEKETQEAAELPAIEENEPLIIGALTAVMEDTYVAPQLRDLNQDLRFMPSMLDDLPEDDDIVYEEFDDEPSDFDEEEAIDYDEPAAPIQYAKPRFSGLGRPIIPPAEDKPEEDEPSVETPFMVSAEETSSEEASPPETSEIAASDELSPDEMTPVSPTNEIVETTVAEAVEPTITGEMEAAPAVEESAPATDDLEDTLELDKIETTEANPVSAVAAAESPASEEQPAAEEDSPAEPPPVYLYRVSMVVTPEIEAEVRALREAAKLTPADPGFYLLYPEAYCDDPEALIAAVRLWAEAHLPLALTLDQVEAETVGAQRYVAGWLIMPEEDFTAAQQALADAISPILKPLYDPLIAARLAVGDQLQPKEFPLLVRELNSRFTEPMAWEFNAVEILRTPEADRRWEVLIILPQAEGGEASEQ